MSTGNGNLKGFSTVIPENVKNLKITQEKFDDPNVENVATFDENGNATIEGHQQGRLTKANFTANGEEYELGYLWGI